MFIVNNKEQEIFAKGILGRLPRNSSVVTTLLLMTLGWQTTMHAFNNMSVFDVDFLRFYEYLMGKSLPTSLREQKLYKRVLIESKTWLTSNLLLKNVK